LGLGEGIATPHRKIKEAVTKYYTEPRAWTDSLERPRQRKVAVRFGTWTVRSLYMAGSLKTVASELAKYNLDLVAV